MRSFLFVLGLVSLSGCTTETTSQPGAGGTAPATAAQDGSTAAGSGSDGSVQADGSDGVPADGSETEANISTVGRCSGEHVAPTTAANLSLTLDNAMAALEGNWVVGLTPFQEDCLEALNLALRGDEAEVKSKLEDGDLKEWAILVASKQAASQGNRQEVSEAQEVLESLTNLSEISINIAQETLTQTGEHPFTGSIKVTDVDGDKVTVSRSGEGGDEAADIYFITSTKIYITKGAGSTEGKTFDKQPS